MNTPGKDLKKNRKAKAFEVLIDQDLCKGCGICVDFCPRGVFENSDKINPRGYYQPRIEYEENCSGCNFCELLCPELAIVIIEKKQ